jgi:VanZ family protein
LTRILAVVVLLILYGSLYPWRFVVRPDSFSGAVQLLMYGNESLYLRDALVNVVFYMPVGASGYLSFRGFAPPTIAAMLAVVLGAALSISVEIAQAYQQTRWTSIYDVYANVLGSAIGAGVASVFSRVSLLLNRKPGLQVADGGALVLLVCWSAYLMFPFVPQLSQRTIQAKIASINRIDEVGFVTAIVIWMVVGLAFKASGFRHATLLCFLSLLAIPLQLLIAGRSPTGSMFAGAVIGTLIFTATGSVPGRAKWTAVAMLVLVIFRGLWPFHFASRPQSFTWIPFLSMLASNWQRASQVLIEKLFLYGSTVWLLREAGMRLRTATILTATVLFTIEVLQLWTARTPEITDPLLALMIGFGLDAFHPQAKRTSSPSGTLASGIR